MAQTHSLDLEATSSQYASIADNASLSITGDMTIEAWVKLESLGNGQALVTKWNPTGNQRSYVVYLNATAGDVTLYVSSNGTAQGNALVAYTFTAGVWIHIAVTYTASTGTMGLYVNGRSVGTATGTLPTAGFDSTSAFLVGAIEPDAPSQFLDGLIKDVRIFNDVRTQTEIVADARTENVSNANLVAEWNFNNAYTDSSGNGFTLTASGSPVFSTDRPWVASTQVDGSTYLETNLVSWWNLNESSDGTSAVTRVDSHGVNNLTDNNTTASGIGKISNGADFERTNTEYLSIADASQTGLDLTGDMSFSLWVNFETYDGTGEDYVLVSKVGYGAAQERSYSIELNIITNNSIGFHTSADGTSSGARGQIAWTVSTATWYHIVVVYRASAGAADVYRNGIQLGTITGLNTSVFNSNAAFQISGALDGAAQAYQVDGIMDEVAAYSRALHYGDVLDLYNAGSGITYVAASTFIPAIMMS